MNRRTLIRFTGPPALVLLGVFVLAAPAVATGSVVGTIVQVPDHPFAEGCQVVNQPSGSINYFSAEVEPWVAVNPANPANIIGIFQQDRWNNGGAHGLVAAVSFDGGTTYTTTSASFDTCTGGTGTPTASGGDAYERASDPWVSFAPNGDAYQVSISFNGSNPDSSVLVSKSPDGGSTWSTPVTLRFDNVSTVFNDKESVTADPNTLTGSNAYVVWDQLVFPQRQANQVGAERTFAFRGPTWFSRTTNGGSSWQTARAIFDPGQENQTISNQIVVEPASKAGTLIDGFDLIHNFSNAGGLHGFSIALIRSADQGATWSGPIVISKQVDAPVTLAGQPIRTGDIVPEFAVDPSNGNLYAVWQDGRSGVAAILFSMSTDGGSTWTAPVQVSQAPSGNPAFTPTVRVAGDGTIGVSYYAANPTTAETVLSMVTCQPSSLTDCSKAASWSGSQVQVAGPFNMLTAPFAEGFFVGDYEGLTTAGQHGFRSFFVMAQPEATTGDTDPFTTTVCPSTGC
jgi:hypothetical protein